LERLGNTTAHTPTLRLPAEKGKPETQFGRVNFKPGTHFPTLKMTGAISDFRLYMATMALYVSLSYEYVCSRTRYKESESEKISYSLLLDPKNETLLVKGQ